MRYALSDYLEIYVTKWDELVEEFLRHLSMTSLAVLLARDPVYTEVVRAIRTACAAEPAVSEMALCVGMRQYLLEDIRQCMAIAEHFGQIRRQAQAGDSLVIASFHPTT